MPAASQRTLFLYSQIQVKRVKLSAFFYILALSGCRWDIFWSRLGHAKREKERGAFFAVNVGRYDS